MSYCTNATVDLAPALGVPEHTSLFVHDRLLSTSDNPFRTPGELYAVLSGAGIALRWTESVRATNGWYEAGKSTRSRVSQRSRKVTTHSDSSSAERARSVNLPGEHERVARLTVPTRPADLHAIRHWAACHVTDLPPTVQADVVLLCNALVSNAETHRGGVREIRLLRPDPGCVRVEVDDWAPPPVVRPAPSNWTPEGLHLLLIERLCARWGAAPGRGGTTMWAYVPVVAPRKVTHARHT
ncbi:ATP-binding protein [Kibdelosporangium aridum]|uniref:ATP-binding protein n=1 Tax=Kibdelosporangium aridum TaxID=2030 RepID=UPI00068DFBCB